MHRRLPVAGVVPRLPIEAIDEYVGEGKIAGEVGVELDCVKTPMYLAPGRHADEAAVIQRKFLAPTVSCNLL
jgi:hypothetical protein